MLIAHLCALRNYAHFAPIRIAQLCTLRVVHLGALRIAHVCALRTYAHCVAMRIADLCTLRTYAHCAPRRIAHCASIRRAHCANMRVPTVQRCALRIANL